MLAFLEFGLLGTSMRHLETTTGVKQVSLYNAFGDKEGLFLAVLDRYTDLILHMLDQHLDNRDLDGIAAFVRAIVSPESTYPHIQFGCLMVNTAMIAEAESAICRRVQAWRTILHARFVAALKRAKSRGKLKRGLNLNHCADFVVSTLWGIFVTIGLAGGDQTVGIPAAKVLNRTMRDWRAGPG
jgi:TetR/AcrR family transcriptional repressor of nem operon